MQKDRECGYVNDFTKLLSGNIQENAVQLLMGVYGREGL
jgi:hypothetical protein